MSDALPPGAFAQALLEKRSAERRRTLLTWGIGVGVALLLLVGGWLVFFSPVLAVKNVAVNGLGLLTTDQVTEAAAVEMGVPLVRTDVDQIRERIAALPEVKEVRVTRDFPSTIGIDVTERALVFQRALAGQIEWIDAEGTVFHRTPEPTDGALQVQTETTDQRLLADIATVAANLPDVIRPDVTGVTAETVDTVTITLADDRTVIWGSAEESELKGDVLEALLSVEAKVYDVSAPRHPTTR